MVQKVYPNTTFSRGRPEAKDKIPYIDDSSSAVKIPSEYPSLINLSTLMNIQYYTLVTSFNGVN